MTKSAIFFSILIRKRDFRSKAIQLMNSCTRVNETKTLKNNRAFVTLDIKPKQFLKMPCLRKLTDKFWLRSSEFY